MNESAQKGSLLKCVQINLQHSADASAVLSQLIVELQIDVIFIQEPHCNASSWKVSHVPVGYKVYHYPSNDYSYSSAIMLRRNILVRPLLDLCCNEVVGLQLVLDDTTVPILSIYCRPSAPQLNDIMQSILSNQKFNMDSVVLCMDSNAHDPLWNSSFTDQKGIELVDIVISKRLHVVNVLKEDLEVVPRQTTFVDVTLVGEKMSNNIANWRFSDIPSLSDHPYIMFELCLSYRKMATSRHLLPKLEHVNCDLLRTLIQNSLPNPQPLLTVKDIDSAVETLVNSIRQSAKNKQIQIRRPLEKRMYWWTDNLAQLRAQYRKAKRAADKWPSTETQTLVSNTKRLYRSKIRTTQKIAFKSFCTQEQGTDLFKVLRKLSGKANRHGDISSLKNESDINKK